MKPGDVVLVRFPQADLQAGKLRPIPLQSAVQYLIELMIPSRIPNREGGRHDFGKSNQRFYLAPT